ncbi:MAG: restriction endonuclease [Kiritimatiellia bacterium]|jgi:hypothetical protein
MKALIQTGSSLSACGHAQAGGRVPVPLKSDFLSIDQIYGMRVRKNNLQAANDVEFNIRSQEQQQLLEILLLDRTKSSINDPQNIIWANDNYKEYDAVSYAAKAQIRPDLITGKQSSLIMPRALKAAALQKKRTKTKAEVFTPTWIVKKQIDAVESDYKADDLQTYVSRKWLEITCGEAPYMATRYDMETGELVPLAERCGFVDRKLARINAEVKDKAEWQCLVELAYQSSYGFEWNGDSLLLARENLLYTYRDYYIKKWRKQPMPILLNVIAKIISYNVFQMDGLTYTIPLSQTKVKKKIVQTFFPLNGTSEPETDEWEITQGMGVKIMNWNALEMELFETIAKPNANFAVRENALAPAQCSDPLSEFGGERPR